MLQQYLLGQRELTFVTCSFTSGGITIQIHSILYQSLIGNLLLSFVIISHLKFAKIIGKQFFRVHEDEQRRLEWIIWD